LDIQESDATQHPDVGRSGSSIAGLGVLLLAIQGILVSLFLNPSLLKLLLPALTVPFPRRVLVVTAIHFVGIVFFAVLAWRWRAVGRTGLAQYFFVRVPVLGGLAIGSGTLFVVFAVQELFFYGLNTLHEMKQPTNRVESVIEGEMYCDDSLLGFRGIPCAVRHRQATLQPANTPLFDAVYHLDASGYRVVPQEELSKQMHLATFGCSFMFGEGVNDTETLPAQLACQQPQVDVSCFAMPGYSPAQVPLLFGTGAIDQLTERDGAALYLFIPDHVNRVIAARRRALRRTTMLPAFQLDMHGAPQYLGLFTDRYPTRIAINETVLALNASRWMGLNSIVPPRMEHMELCVALLDLARREYQTRYPGNEFYVLLDPSCHINGFDLATLCDYMDARKLRWLDPGQLYGAEATGRFYFEGDGHPTPEAHARMAAWFWEQFPDGLLAGPHP